MFWADKLLREGVLRGLSINDKVAQKKIDDAEIEYSQKCGAYDEKELNCIRINSQLQSAIQFKGAKALSPFDTELANNEKSIALYRKQFDDNNCAQVIEQYRQKELGTVIDKFSDLDKKRIESESIYERNQRVFFGALILISGIVIITMFGKNK